MKLSFSKIKEIKSFCEDLHSTPCYREVIENADSSDFEVEDVRFIDSDSIDSVLAEELQSDLYILGCFNAWFISEQTDIDQDVIEALQEAEAFEALGKLIVKSCDMVEFAQAYAGADGYGHHFNRYDFGQEEIQIGDTLYYVFDNH